ncbi:MAG: serine/threonine protein phosphatase [Bradyrhizobium sp.]|nr:serine/threonine protein phosphatase [Bradyrhizobium sp.]
MRKGRAGKAEQRARTPPGIRVYAIGDIHGCADLLEKAFASIDNEIATCGAGRVIQVFLGDYVDRGPDTKRTLDLLIDRSRTHETVFVRGNHEQLMVDFLDQPSVLSRWWSMGGAPTLLSYGLSPRSKWKPGEEFSLRDELVAAMPESHQAFLASLQSAYSCGDFFFTHAGVQPGVALDRQRVDDLMWIRDPFLNSQHDFGKVVVHGHTPVREPEVHHNRINIDTGAYATGRLSILSIEDSQRSIHVVSRSGVTTSTA